MTIEYIPGLAGVPATKSKISDIDGQKGMLYYRGYAIEELAEKSSFEETTLLLLDGELPSASRTNEFNETLTKNRRINVGIERVMGCLPKSSHPMQVLQVGVSLLSSFFNELQIKKDGKLTVKEQYDMAVTIISQIGTLVAVWENFRHGLRPHEADSSMSYAENFLYMIHGKKPEDYMVEIFNKCLVLHAEHTINASTFTAMVTGSTLANPCSTISAAIGSLSGHLHGGANSAVLEMILEIGSPDKAEAYIDKKLKNKEVIWGMGHREYKTKDPRAKLLEKTLDELLGKEGVSSNELEIAKKVEQICEDRLSEKEIYPNVDFYSGILYKSIGLENSLYVPIFAMARSAGWLAHLMEQLDNNKIFRPTQIYEGFSPRNYQ